jgi:hypothetical protein
MWSINGDCKLLHPDGKNKERFWWIYGGIPAKFSVKP